MRASDGVGAGVGNGACAKLAPAQIVVAVDRMAVIRGYQRAILGGLLEGLLEGY